MKMKPGFTLRKVRPDPAEISDWRTCIPISAAQLLGFGQIISLGNKYFLSAGHHEQFLLGRHQKEPLTFEKSLSASALLTFAIDAPVVPDYTVRGYRPSDFSTVERGVTQTGIQSSDYFDVLMNVAEMVGILTDIGNTDFAKEREIPLGRAGGRYPYLSWPSSARTWRALTAYWSAILSIVVPGRILNFWRAIEAVTDTVAERHAVFENLERSRIKPVWTRSLVIRSPGVPDVRRVRNSARLLKRHVLLRRRELITMHGTTKDALDWLYWERRGKAAHADKSSLDFEGLSSFSDQVSDAILFQYMARVAIEHKWS